MECPPTSSVRSPLPPVATVPRPHLPAASVIDIGLDRPNLRYHVMKAQTERKKQAILLRILERQPGCGIIYAATVRTVDALADYLHSQGVECGRYHGRMRAKDRAAASLTAPSWS